MIQFIAGEKGQGKTKKLLAMANARVEESDGNIVFIDDDSRHIYDLKHNIRFVETKGYELSTYKEFIGFLYGILSQNNDITDIFIDGLANIISEIPSEDLVTLIDRLKSLSTSSQVDFTISINYVVDNLPAEAKDLLV